MIDKDKTICSDAAESFRLSSMISGGKNFILDYKGRKFSLSLSPFFIGRDNSCSLTIQSKQVSRQHCVLYRFGNKFIVRDLHSTNGIKLNGSPITSENIRPGDIIQIGTEEIKVEQGKVDLPISRESQDHKDLPRWLESPQKPPAGRTSLRACRGQGASIFPGSE